MIRSFGIFPGIDNGLIRNIIGAVAYVQGIMRTNSLFIAGCILVLCGCVTTPLPDPVMAARSLQRAKQLYLDGNYKAANVAFQEYRAHVAGPQRRAQGYYWEGMCWLAQRDFARARERFEFAMEQEPRGWLRGYVLCELGEALMGLGDFAAARESYREALETSPRDIRLDHVLLRIATCAQRLNEWDLAGGYLNKLLREVPGSRLADQAKEKLQYNKGRFFTVQVAAFRSREAARERATQLRSRELRPFIGQIERGGEKIYCVWIGRFESWKEANLEMQRIRGMGRIENAIVKP